MKTRLFLILLTLPLIASAQNTFQPGYYLENDGTRKEGFIYNIGWKDSPVAFEFKASEGAAAEKKTISQVGEFSVGEHKFVRFTTEIERSRTMTNYLDESATLHWNKETIYLKLLVPGQINLYQYEDGNVLKFFYGTGEGATQLIHKKYSVDSKIHENNQFRGQLYELMKDKMKGDRFKTLDYDKDDLMEVFAEYNGVDLEAASESQGPKPRLFNVKITAGASVAFLSLTQRSGSTNPTVDLDAEPVFRIGAEFEFILPINNNKWSVFADPNFQAYQAEKSVTEGNTVSKWKAEYKYVEIPLGLRHYMFLSPKTKLFIDAAYIIGIPAKKTIIEYDFSLNGTTTFNPTAEVNQTNSFAIGTGISHGKYSAALRYNIKRPLLNNYAYWTADYSSIGVILGYRIL